MGKKKPIVTPFGQWEYPGEVTIIPSNNITMQGVNYPVLGIDNLGNQELMMPGMDYTFPGDYVTEIPQMGKGGLTQWFAEEWTDIKTGKPCGRSGKDKDGRPYPACRPKKRVNETTPKTTSEMSSAEKAKFKREKTSGKRIDYNHKRKQQGGQWYTTQEWDDAMPDSTAENIVEFFDPTGYTSHDDARRAYQKWKKSGSTLPSFEEGMDMFGAVPALGKLGKLKYLADPDAMKAVYKYLPWQQIINAADTVQDEVEKKKYGGWLDNYQKGGETSTEQNPTRIAPVDIRVKRKKVSDSNRYMYDAEGNLVYNPSLTIYPEIAKGSTKGETTFQPNIPVNLLNPTLEELVNVAAPYYPIDNRLTSGDRINLPASDLQRSLEQDYIVPQMVGRSFGNLPLNKGNTIDDGYGPNRRWTTNLNENPGNYFLNSPETYAYILKGDKSSLVDYDQSVGYDKKQQVESGMSNLNQRFDEALATQGYNIEMVDDYTANRPDQIWNRAEQVRVEMLNNPEIREWAKLHNLDLSNKYRSKYDRNNKNIKPTETDDNFASKIPESVYASRLAQAGLPTNRPDYYYGGRKTFIIQDPSKFNLAGYFPIDQEMIDSARQMGEYVNDSSANLKNIMAERMGVDPKNFDNGEYLIHYNRSPISEYTPGKKYGGWLNQYQEGGEKTPLENFERIEQVNIKSKQAPWYVRYPRMFGRAIDNKLTDFGHQYAQRISDATGGSEWYKQSNPFMNVALESMNAPQLAATYAVTGKVQTPSEAMDIQNPYGAFAVDALLDPAVAFGVGKGLVKGAPGVVKYATRTPLKDSYRDSDFYRNFLQFKSRPNTNTNLNLEELRRIYHNSERILQPKELRFLHKQGHGSRNFYRTQNSIWNNIFNPNLTPEQLNILSDIESNNNLLSRGAPTLTREQAEQMWLKSPRGTNVSTTPQSNYGWGTDQWNVNNQQSTILKPKNITNKSGLTKEEAIAKASAKDKDVISKMSEQEFQETVLKPTGEVVPYYQGSLESQFTGKNNVFFLSPKQYADEFNSRLDLLNDIIAKNNKSGVEYRVSGLSPNGGLTFYTPPGQKVKNHPFITSNPDTGYANMPEGTNAWTVRLNPGMWEGDVEDIASTQYLRSIPGLEMSNTTSGVFADNVPRKGTAAYESINEYLKKLNLGRVKPGFNSQTDYSRGAWENFIKSGRGVGFYSNPKTIYGTMKSAFPYIGIGGAGIGAGASQINNKKYGGWLDEYQGGGETSTEQNPDRMQEIKIAATSPGVKTFANTLFDGGKWLAKNFIKYHPGLRFTTKVLGTGLNYFKDEVFDKYRPIEYPDVLDAIIKLNNPSVEPLKDKKGNLSPSEEAWRKGLGFKDDFKYIKPASYKPADSEDNDAEYVRFENMYDPQKLINAYVKAQKELKPGKTKVLIPSLDPYIKGRKNLEASGVAFSQQDPLQNFTLDKGEDEKGKYISLYDVYDFGPLITDLVYGFKKPYEVYDRFYYEKNKQGIPVYKKKDGGQTNWLKKYK